MTLLRKHVLAMITTVICAIGLVMGLTSTTLKIVNQKNGFNRLFIYNNLAPLNIIQKDPIVNGLSGHTDKSLYFKTRNPSILFVTDHTLHNKRSVNLNLRGNDEIATLFYSSLDSPDISIMAGNIPAVINTDFKTGKSNYFRFPSSIFTRAIKISRSSYVFRGFDTTVKSKDQIFIKGNPVTGVMQRENTVSEKNNDAGISTDGLMHYDSMLKRIVYIYFYKNEFICLDTNLGRLYAGHTIDTIRTIQTKAGGISSGKISNYSNIAPSRLLNAQSCVSNGRLYNNSKLQADNDANETFAENSTIDVYNLSNGLYEGSFYIPDYKHEKIRQFRIVNNALIAIYKNYIITYTLPKLLPKKT